MAPRPSTSWGGRSSTCLACTSQGTKRSTSIPAWGLSGALGHAMGSSAALNAACRRTHAQVGDLRGLRRQSGPAPAALAAPAAGRFRMSQSAFRSCRSWRCMRTDVPIDSESIIECSVSE